VYCYVEGIARRRAVETGDSDGNRVEIRSGLKEGEEIIAQIPAEIVDGSRVRLRTD
jgi:multidrug efflux pump subunit AcrA (membrane-fusion protein)